VDRGDAFGQSLGRFNITRSISKATRRGFYMNDWFHTMVNTKTYRVVAIVVAVYLLLYVIFTLLYMIAVKDTHCMPELLHMNKHHKNGSSDDDDDGALDDDGSSGSGEHHSLNPAKTFLRLFFFSVETMMTIGYGVGDPYFGDCPLMLVLITAQSLVGIFASSILFGIVLTRAGRASSRAGTVAFSSRAIVRSADDELYLVLRVAEMRTHQLCQAYVHAYAMCDSADVIGDTAAASEGSSVHALPMTLTHPTGEMMLVTPCFIVHRLDARSPLMPPELDEVVGDLDPRHDELDDHAHHLLPTAWYDAPPRAALISVRMPSADSPSECHLLIARPNAIC